MDNTIYFYIPDPMRLYDLNTRLFNRMDTHPDRYRDNVKVGAVYGCFPGNIWNGGRVCVGSATREQIEHCIQIHNYNQMPIRFTWTNVALKKKHLKDEECNWITKIAENGLNEILVNDPKLEQYIRDKYPNYPLVSSTTKCLNDIDLVNEELEKDYKMVVLDYRFNNDWEYLDAIKHHEKCEILVNAACNPHCTRRAAHYLSLSQEQIKRTGQEPPEFASCGTYTRKFSELKKFPTFVSWDLIEKEYIPRGFRHFKIEGRNTNPMIILEYYVHYFVKEEYQEVEREYLSDGIIKMFLQPFYEIGE